MVAKRTALIVGLAAIVIAFTSSVGGSAAALASGVEAGDEAGLRVALSGAENTVSWDAREDEPERFELPVVFLRRQREVASEADRTLVVTLTGLKAGTAVELALTSLHADVTDGEPHRQERAYTPERNCTVAAPCTVRWTLDAAAIQGSDLYRLQVKDAESGERLWGGAEDRPDLVALDTWEMVLQGHTVRIHYATLFPYVRGQDGPEQRLSPAAVTDLIERTYIPMVEDAWRVQFGEWGLGPVHDDWDADDVVEIYITCPPYALYAGTGIYSRSFSPDGTPFPERRLWWFSSSAAYDGYDTLENGYKVVFSHEFFHLAQWNVAVSAGCSMERWNNIFIEGQGKFAPTVQYPEIEMTDAHVAQVSSAYRSAARHYLSHRLNASYGEMEQDPVYRYDTALYWRFLYEQSGEMDVIRAALEEMACRYDPDVEAHLGEVMDAALARVESPFETFEESLVAFARANYALRLEDGRCTELDVDACAGRYYDPDELYKAPDVETSLRYSGSPLRHEDAVPAGYGMDLVEVELDRAASGALRITVQGEGRFSVQVWQLSGGAAETSALALASEMAVQQRAARALTAQPQVATESREGAHVLSIPDLDTAKCTRIALIVTRLDVEESGSYTLTVERGSR